MKKVIVTTIALICALAQSKGVIISDFGSGSFSIDSGTTTFSTVNQAASNTQVAGLDTDIFAGIFATPFDATGYTTFSLNAKVTGTNPASSFNIDFFNSDFSQNRTYSAFLSSFGSGTDTTVTLTFVNETASFSDFGGFVFTGGGGGSALNITFNNVSATAVPEPATWVLLAGSLTTVMIFRRRRSKF